MSGGGISLCPRCLAENTDADLGGACSRCATPLRLRGRFVVRELLATKTSARTLRADDLDSGGPVVIKELSLAQAADWKQVELFERAARVLQGLEHAGVPDFIAHWTDTRDGGQVSYSVQAFVEGRSLAAALDAGERFDEARARGVARSLLEVLRYLHGLSPPVIHRDLKPGNVILTSAPEERCVLVDFDLVRDRSAPGGGSTMAIGTIGYAPLEQLMGRPVPATDLYALGATLITLLARRDPADLFDPSGHRLDFREHVNVSPGFAEFLEGLVEPALDRRVASAEEALAALDAPSGDEGGGPLALPAVGPSALPVSISVQNKGAVQTAVAVPEHGAIELVVEAEDGLALTREVSTPWWVMTAVLIAGTVGAGAAMSAGATLWMALLAYFVALIVIRHPVRVRPEEVLHHGVMGNASGDTKWVRWQPLVPAYLATWEPFVIVYRPAALVVRPGLAVELGLRVTVALSREPGGKSANFSGLLSVDSWTTGTTTAAGQLRTKMLPHLLVRLSRPEAIAALDEGPESEAHAQLRVALIPGVEAGFAEMGYRVVRVEVEALAWAEPEAMGMVTNPATAAAIDHVLVERLPESGASQD
ncbi:serine/threonine protein kinase [Plesiocystis pacifica SIR-1]|uniref:non-specific serine/threonine protein kinase n=1 Tax=Plesiocystis pacifica SIR-1 TaxID=391625 RepID=A6G0N7_9BACT|nr:protein kinase [Plesiocystis pacifica]EDM80683.1 serine/threonine protein kinase [Plesiocystis pacifica SIR-1]